MIPSQSMSGGHCHVVTRAEIEALKRGGELAEKLRCKTRSHAVIDSFAAEIGLDQALENWDKLAV